MSSDNVNNLQKIKSEFYLQNIDTGIGELNLPFFYAIMPETSFC